ncbi:MAG: EAL domain-containing protein [Gammaproteobacteria bacterium]|nr:MAG: EAL domain-containing protein [Gammaproteobacteria bacterium]
MPRILVAEESATLRYILVRMLEHAGHTVEQIEDWPSLAETLAGSTRPDALVLGWPEPVPEEMTGILEQLSSTRLQGLPALFLTHEPPPELLQYTLERKASALVPWESHAELSEGLETLLQARPETPPEADHAAQGSDRLRILLVDDSRSIRLGYRRILERAGHQVTGAGSVDEAWQRALEQPFDLAIIDYFMPGKNGDALCRMLRNDPRTRNIRLSVLTGTYLDEVIARCLEAGAVECMFKNESMDLFLARVQSISRHVHYQREIEAERSRLAAILESVGDGVYGVDPEGHITFINPAACRILGFDTPPLGESAFELFHGIDTRGRAIPGDHCPLQQSYASGRPLAGHEGVFRTRDNRVLPVACSAYPLIVNGERQGMVVAFRDVSEQRLLEEQLRWQATHDPLTELFNRRYFEEELEREVQRHQRGEPDSALLYIDLDQFKYLNDTAGHEAGDRLLIDIGRQLERRLRRGDTLARLGGDEFALILRNIERETIEEIAENFRQMLSEYRFHAEGRSYNIGGSIGIAIIDGDTRSSSEALANADIACHIAKRNGRNQVHLYDPSQDERAAMDMDLGWSSRLREALEEGHFVLHYQPIVALADIDMNNLPPEEGGVWQALADMPLHFEVLLRLRAETGELIPPGAFLTSAERFNIMPAIDLWVLRRALRELQRYETGRKATTTFSINLSASTLNDDKARQEVLDEVRNARLQNSALIFEITETTAIDNFSTAQHFMEELRALDCRIALDDFGTGFSSFSQLKAIDANYVKIDGQYVHNMARDPIDRAIVTSMNDIAHSLGLKTVAEFVESAETLRLLKVCGVDYVQGYYIQRPLLELTHPERAVRPLHAVGRAEGQQQGG